MYERKNQSRTLLKLGFGGAETDFKLRCVCKKNVKTKMNTIKVTL